MRAPLVATVLVLALLAGCSGPAAPTRAPQAGSGAADTDFADLGLRATSTTAVVLGVVVDEAIRPLPGATVVLDPGNRTQETDAHGRFGYSDLEPGTYVLRASLAGHAAAQTTVDAQAGVDDPRPTLVLLESLPGTAPYVTVLAWDGFMECSLIAAGFFFSGCMAADVTSDDSRRTDPVEAEPAWLQSELVWEGTQELGANLCMKHYARVVADPGDFAPLEDQTGESAGTCGPTPVLQAFDADVLNDTGVGTGYGIERVVWVDEAFGDMTVGLSLEQRFTVYTHMFHNFTPREGWRFTVDGEHPLPRS